MISESKVLCFVSYPRARRELCARFTDFALDVTLREIASVWMDDALHPGELWDQEIRDRLLAADIILVLLSPAFLASDYCVNVEGALALERAARKEAKVFAVLLEECDYAAYGFDVLPLVSDRGAPLRTTAAFTAATLKLKETAYELFEQENRAIQYDDIVENFECALVRSHWQSNQALTTPRDKRRWLLGGAATGAAVGYVASRVMLVDGVFAVPLLLCGLGSVLNIIAALIRRIQLFREGLPRPRSDVLRAAILGLFGLFVPAMGLAFILFLAQELPRRPTLVVASAVVGMLFFVGTYAESRPQRLAIYRELVRARRVPRGGWLVDTLEPEVMRRREAHKHSVEEARRAERLERPPLPSPPLPPPEVREELPAQVEPKGEPQPERDWDELMRQFREHEKAQRKRRWTLLDDEPRTGRRRSLVIFFHPDDEVSRSAFETVLRKEGGDDLCDIRFCPIDEWRSALDGAEIVVALLSPRFLASTATDALYAAIGKEVIVLPVQLQAVAPTGLFAERQFLPAERPIAEWPAVEVGYQHVVRYLLARASLVEWADGLPPLKRMAWDGDATGAMQWTTLHAGWSAFASVIVWALMRHWHWFPASLALTAVPVVVAMILLYRETKRRNIAEFDIEWETRLALVLAVTPLWLTAAALAALIYAGLFAISIAVTTDATPRALITFVDVGFVGGVLFGCAAYFATRRHRPVVLLNRKPPTLKDAERAARHAGVPRRSPRAIARLLAETIIFTAPVAILFTRIGNGSGPILLRLAVAAWIALWVQGILLGLYELLMHRIADRHAGRKVSLRSRARYALLPRLFQLVPYAPLWVWIIVMVLFAALAMWFSAPLAPPILSAVLIGAVLAAMESMGHIISKNRSNRL